MKKKTRETPLLVGALTAALLALSPAAHSQGAEPDANAVADKIQEYYAGADDFVASFVQTTAHKLFAGRLERSYGKVMFKKGGLMRWEYKRPDRKFFIYDGAILWVYEPDVPQVFKGAADADKLKRALAFLTGEGKIKKEYRLAKVDAAKYGYAEGIVLKCFPKAKGSPFKHIELYVEKGSYRVARSVVVDHEGNRNRLDLASPQTNTGLSDNLFKFTPPPGVTVLTSDQ